MQRKRISVYGSVQGVFFRHNTKKEANKLDLTGWCRNESDGTVAIEVQGEEEKIERFINWVHQGSPLAQVTKVVTAKIDLEKEDEEFEIR